ncbi:RNA polymerase sigma factor [Pedobacter insulae]|uniref:RNA polymerase sigma-70 factor, Bacteroides expansion family 1 n=1 Tax=Pedobacter insulae TaxID=414048 RepID=A0A1I2XJN4_9SPHI|nr:RNA polymerase sigma-70 factor [Pedobacter insulae]SFH12281.1 RNA polymerase sigma-70 factor, Bacteroides expansion family 1 [Pedobacter insulae]
MRKMIDYDGLSDHKLTELLSEEDRIAFAQIFKRYNKILLIHAYKKLEQQEVAEDIVQEVFSMLWQKRGSISISTNLAGYLYASVKNKALDVIARRKTEALYVDSLKHFVGSGVALTDHLVRERQMKEIIEREVSRLPTKMRRVFELSRSQHLSHKEIASELKLSEHTVTDQIKKALKILRTKMGMCFFLVL